MGGDMNNDDDMIARLRRGFGGSTPVTPTPPGSVPPPQTRTGIDALAGPESTAQGVGQKAGGPFITPGTGLPESRPGGSLGTGARPGPSFDDEGEPAAQSAGNIASLMAQGGRGGGETRGPVGTGRAIDGPANKVFGQRIRSSMVGSPGLRGMPGGPAMGDEDDQLQELLALLGGQ
jgi:hypothetical protein